MRVGNRASERINIFCLRQRPIANQEWFFAFFWHKNMQRQACLAMLAQATRNSPLGQQFFRLNGRFRGRVRALPLKIRVLTTIWKKLRHRIRTL